MGARGVRMDVLLDVTPAPPVQGSINSPVRPIRRATTRSVPADATGAMDARRGATHLRRVLVSISK